MAPMTRTQTRAYGVLNPSTRQPLLEAMLRVFAWLVSNLVSLFGTILNRRRRDWHTDAAGADQLPTPNDLTQETNPAQRRNQTRCASPLRLAAPQRSTSPSFAGGGLRASPVESSLAEGGGGVRRALARMTEGAVPTTRLSPVIPAAALQRADPEPGSRAHDRQHTLLLGSRSARLRRCRGTDTRSVRAISA